MIATALNPTTVYGEILSRNVYQTPPSELPSVGRFLSQGAALGALFGFIPPLHSMLSSPENGYNFILVGALPIFLAGGMAFGLFEGVLIWAVTYVTGHRLHPFLRVVLATMILFLLIALFIFLYVAPPPPDRSATETYLYTFGGYLAYGILFGLTIGSRFRPLYELVRGATPRWPVMNGITGVLLRIFVVFSLMESILCLILSLQGDFKRSEFTFAVIGLCHFGVAAVLVFGRLPFWLLLPLALIINIPIGALITDVLTDDQVGTVLRIITLNYLALWAAFVFCRFSLPRAARIFIKEEARYYLGLE